MPDESGYMEEERGYIEEDRGYMAEDCGFCFLPATAKGSACTLLGQFLFPGMKNLMITLKPLGLN
jgi:hypothetical protein